MLHKKACYSKIKVGRNTLQANKKNKYCIKTKSTVPNQKVNTNSLWPTSFNDCDANWRRKLLGTIFTGSKL